MTRRINGLSQEAREGWLHAIGTRLRNERRRQGLSIHALAERANVSSSTIHRIEHYAGEPGLITAYRLALALDVELTWFSAGDGMPCDITGPYGQL